MGLGNKLPLSVKKKKKEKKTPHLHWQQNPKNTGRKHVTSASVLGASGCFMEIMESSG